jgi:hypothetical protein
MNIQQPFPPLRPCPFCGAGQNTNLFVANDGPDMILEEALPDFIRINVLCGNCGVTVNLGTMKGQLDCPADVARVAEQAARDYNNRPLEPEGPPPA